MIKSFRNQAARAWERRFIKGLSQDVLRIGNRKLVQLHNARSLSDLRAPPGKSPRWRVCFAWDNGDAFGVEIVDYHILGWLELRRWLTFRRPIRARSWARTS
jgi:proteic killer suppression protein